MHARHGRYKNICSENTGVCPSDCDHPVSYINGLLSNNLLGTYSSQLSSQKIIVLQHAPAGLADRSVSQATLVNPPVFAADGSLVSLPSTQVLTVTHTTGNGLKPVAPLASSLGDSSSSSSSVSANDPRDPELKAAQADSALADAETSATALANKILANNNNNNNNKS